MCSSLKECASRGQFTKIAQAYELVEPGMILARHIFQGLKRPLNTDGSQNGDAEKLIYTWKPVWDYEWSEGRQGSPARKKAPSKKVFFVIVTPNIKHAVDYPEINGWIEHWSWWDEDSAFPNAPIEWVDRFTKKLFTAESPQARLKAI